MSRSTVVRLALVGMAALVVSFLVSRSQHASDLAEHRADPNRWACMYAVRGFAYADNTAEYEAIIATASSFATDPKVKAGLRRYGAVAKAERSPDPNDTNPYVQACAPYLPFNRFDP